MSVKNKIIKAFKGVIINLDVLFFPLEKRL